MAGPRYAPAGFTRRAALTAGTAAGLTGLYAGYAATVTPLLTGAATAAAREADARPTKIAPPTANRLLADRFLAHAPFAAEARYQVGANHSLMYWDAWEIVRTQKGDSLRVSPFAMVVADEHGTDPADGGKAPTTLTADSALLRFDKPISEDAVTSPGRVVLAGFDGAVRVDGGDGLRVTGSRFVYQEDPGQPTALLYSDRPVAFRHGASGDRADGSPSASRTGGALDGTGAGVEVRLFRTKTPAEYATVAVDGLAEVRVRGPVDVTRRGGGLPGLDAAGGPLPAKDKTKDAGPDEPARIASTGPFTFDPHANTARFESVDGTGAGVRAWRDAPAEPGVPAVGPDELTCETLRVRFEPVTAAAIAEAADVREARRRRDWGDRKFFAADDDLEAVAVVAEGSFQAPVTVLFPGRKIKAVAAKLEHDVLADVLTLTGFPTDPDGAGRVRLRLPDAGLLAPKIVVLPPEPDATPDERVGDSPVGDKRESPRRVRCSGPGLLVRQDPATNRRAEKVTWPGALSTGRDAATGRDVIVLTGPATPRRNGRGHTDMADQVRVLSVAEGADLFADRVVLELEPNPAAKDDPGDAGALGGADPLGGSVRPAAARARGSVRMRGPDLIAGAEEVAVTFADPPPAAPRPDASPSSGGAVQTAEAPAGPAAVPAGPAEKGEDGAAKPTSMFYADRVVATLVRPRTVGGVEVAEGYVSAAEATGGVQLHRDGAAPGEDPEYARAARAVVAGAGPGRQTLTLFGRPATPTATAADAVLSGSGAVLEGREVRFDPAANTATVVGRGAIDLPVRGAAMPGGAADGDAGSEPAAPAGPGEKKTVRVTWGESMTFDGAVASFRGGAMTTFHGKTGVKDTADFTEDTVNLHCDLMTVTLSEPIVFGDRLPGGTGPANRSTSGADPEVELITCFGRVKVKGRQEAPDPRRRAAASRGPVRADPQDDADRFEPEEAQRLEGEFAQLEVTWATGDFTAEGRGEMRLWRRDDKAARPPVESGTVRPNAPSGTRRSLPCELIHIAFERAVAGNLHGPDAVFHPRADGRVTVVHGPVTGFGVPLTRTPTDPLPEGASRMVSRRLRLRHKAPTSGGGAKTRELLASGDVQMDGRTRAGLFWADAPRAAYNEAKGRLSLTGTADGPVRLSRAKTELGARDEQTSRAIEFYPGTNTVETKEVQSLGGAP